MFNTYWLCLSNMHGRIPFLGLFAKLRKATSFVMFVLPSVCLSTWKDSTSTKFILVKFDIWGFFQNLSRKSRFSSNLTRTTGTLHEDQCKFMTVSRRMLFGMINVPDVVEKIKTRILCSVPFSRKSCLLWDNVEKYGRVRQATDDTTGHAISMPDN